MKTIRTFAIAFLMACGFNTVHAQQATPVAIGIRLNPDGGGLTGKFFLSQNWAIEGQLNTSAGMYGSEDGPSMTVAGLLEYHIIFPDPSWRLYFGPGIHFGSWDRYDNGYYENHYNYNGYNHTAEGIFGIDGILGLEYVFKHVPIGLSADIQPAINLAPEATFFPNNFFGLSARYYFGHRMPYHHHNQPVQNPPMER